ncbi:hypothetical protein F4556_002880 [Kitasatospora gansuensis]|uniref:Uncharacterized protein n=1 Tax=Kitasatospora gansuensis TaxID=258050 RepID=A0A7W7SBC6_9ACTN|nr:hypothetical protein [Kitasatospora gansuensis]MBB4947345.1 hypothetical protein [Kitasatospora gansuensis]
MTTLHTRTTVPRATSSVPPRQVVPVFPPIRRGSGGRHRLQRAVRHRPGLLATSLLAAATALAASQLRPGSPPPASAPAVAAEAVTAPRCPGTAPPS